MDAPNASVAGLANRTWKIFNKPFPHCVIRDLFNKDAYAQICQGFEQHQKNASSGTKRGNYDAAIRPISAESSRLFDPLFTPDWLSLVCRAFQRDATYEIDAATHSHPPGSRSGWIHNDYNPGWFAHEAEGAKPIFSDSGNCRYKSNYEGQNSSFVQRIRYITMIYYLLNDGWSEEHGGITGIYSSSNQPVGSPDIAIPPANNTMLIFECRPDSYHSFVSSKMPRNSITLWLHRPIAEARRQWPYHEPVYWK